MKHTVIVIGIVFLSIISCCFIEKSKTMDETNILHTPDKELFESIVQFVIDNGWDAFLSKDNRLTPMVEYKDMLVYIIPNSYTEQRKNVYHYNHIIIFGHDANPASNKGPRFDIYKEKNSVCIKEKTIYSKDTINTYISMLKEMLDIKKIAKNMDSIVSRELFESIVQFVLENGEEVQYSSLWGNSPYIEYKGVSIFLTPNIQNFKVEDIGKTDKNISYYTGMSVFLKTENGHMFNMGIKDNGNIYIHVEIYNNKILYKNDIASICIPLLKEMVK